MHQFVARFHGSALQFWVVVGVFAAQVNLTGVGSDTARKPWIQNKTQYWHEITKDGCDNLGQELCQAQAQLS